MAGSASLRLEKLNGDEGVCNSGAELEVEKKLAASLMFSLEIGLGCVRNVWKPGVWSHRFVHTSIRYYPPGWMTRSGLDPGDPGRCVTFDGSVGSIPGT